MSNEKKGIVITKKWLIIIVIILLLGLYGTVHYYNKYKSLTVDQTAAAQKVTNGLIADLGKLMELPTGETPTVATISDKEKLAGQAFFVNAQNGDILFAYTTSMKAILFRPSTNKIINVAPISINQSQSIAPATKQEVKTTKATSTKATNQ